MDDNCTTYLIDTNIILSTVIKGKLPRKCLETCASRYLVPKYVVDELIELSSTEEFQEIVSRIKKKLDLGKISLEELLSKEIELIAILLRARVQFIDVKPDKDSLIRAEEIVGYRDPDDIPILAIALQLAKTHKDEKICIWTNDDDILDELPKHRQHIKAVTKPHCCK